MSGISELAIIFSLAAALGIVAKLLRQPVILAYLIAGALIAGFGFFDISGAEGLGIFSDLGIMFLLFLVGLEINYTSVRVVGRTAIILGIGQMLFTFIIAYLIAQAFGFSILESSYLAIGLTLSSTIIVVKLLSEKRDLQSLYGRIAIGFMLVQDFVAILLLILLAGIEAGHGAVLSQLIWTIFKGAVLFFAILWLGRKILPLLFDKIARSQEILFVTSLAWLFIFAFVSIRLGLSIEIGGFLAGLALANSSENFQIASRIRSLRDFFILIFFVMLGSLLAAFNFSGLIAPIIILSLFVLIGRPLVILIIMGILGYRRRTSFMTGATVAQVSEFSLIIMAMGLRIGHINENIAAIITAVAVITIGASTYLAVYGDWFVKKMSKFLALFERDIINAHSVPDEGFHKKIILIGADRTGNSLLQHISKSEVLVIDYNPEVVRRLKQQGYSVLFGDIADDEIIERANLNEAKLIISTSPSFQNNMLLLGILKKMPGRRKVVVLADEAKEAELLYKAGAHYVIFPNLTAGHYLGRNIEEDANLRFLAYLKKEDLYVIKHRVK